VPEEGSGQNGLGGVPSVRVREFFFFNSFFFSNRVKLGERKYWMQLGRIEVERTNLVDERDDGIYVLAASSCWSTVNYHLKL
jgi:hypothetical protein